MKDIQSVADAFLKASVTGGVPAEWADSLTTEQGFRVQIAVQELRDRNGDRRVGWKVAATSPAVQRQLGLSEPAFGSLRKSKKFSSGHELGVSELVKPHVECELCFELNENISTVESAEDVMSAVVRCYPAFEIIEKRVPISQFAAAMADNAEHTAIVLGEPIDAAAVRDYSNVSCSLEINGKKVGSETGAAVLGNPLNSIFWLKKRLAEYGQTLPAGALIMTGSFLRQFPIAVGDQFTAEFRGVGEVNVVGVR